MTHDDDTCPHLVRVNLLEAENARLEADNDRLKEAIADSYKAVDEMEQRFKALEAEFETHPMAAEIARLKAEVERLTKAGDALAYRYATALSASYGDGTEEDAIDTLNNDCREELVNWKSAKEGKPQS